MSTVYLAMSGHKQLETVCVVKRLLPALAAQPEHARRFHHEADLARRLVHSNLANTHNIGEVDGEVFLVQEFVEGQDVSALQSELGKRRQSIPIPIAAYIAGELARGLAYAHAFEDLQLVHRDINQPNVRLTYAGEVKLLDFGIASSNLHGERSGDDAVRGKLWHLAPEQVRPGLPVDRRTDIYAVGALLWEMLTGRPLGTTKVGAQEDRTPETEGEVMAWVMRGQHQAPSTFNPDVPFELDALVTKAMHVNPDFRFPTADELRRALSPFMTAELHPEEQLSALMKELFEPERERVERQRLIEAGRDLLVSEGSPSRDMPESVGVSATATMTVGPSFLKRHAAWMAPVALGGVVGIASLVYFHRARQHDGETESSRALVAAAEAVTAPVPAPPNRPASVQPPVLPATRPPEAALAPKPVVGPAASPPLPASPAPTATSTASKTEVAAPKIDHLEVARQAFNERDWPRALSEAKAAAGNGGADAHALIGNIYFKMGRFSDAQKAYARAVALDPKNALLQERLRIAQARAGETP
jgi:eukaryotic-like serine/threonine-protein kinase